MINSPIFEAKKEELLTEWDGDRVIKLIRSEAIPNLAFLIAMRDAPHADARLQLRAARALSMVSTKLTPHPPPVDQPHAESRNPRSGPVRG